MNIRNQRNVYLILDLRQSFGSILVEYRHANDIATCILEPFDLRHGCVDIARVGRGHRLHRDRRISTDRYAADFELPALTTGCYEHLFYP